MAPKSVRLREIKAVASSRVALLLVGLMLLAPWSAAAANNCETDDGAVSVGVFYLHEEQYVYMESNGQPGLQRGPTNSAVGKLLGLPGDDGKCSHPDSILF